MKLKEQFPKMCEQHKLEVQMFSVDESAPYSLFKICKYMYNYVLDFDTVNTTELEKGEWFALFQTLCVWATSAVLFAGKHKCALPLALTNAYISNLSPTIQEKLVNEMFASTKQIGEVEDFLQNLQDISILINYSSVANLMLGCRREELEKKIWYASFKPLQKRFVDDYRETYGIDDRVNGLLPVFSYN